MSSGVAPTATGATPSSCCAGPSSRQCGPWRRPSATRREPGELMKQQMGIWKDMIYDMWYEWGKDVEHIGTWYLSYLLGFSVSFFRLLICLNWSKGVVDSIWVLTWGAKRYAVCFWVFSVNINVHEDWEGFTCKKWWMQFYKPPNGPNGQCFSFFGPCTWIYGMSEYWYHNFE